MIFGTRMHSLHAANSRRTHHTVPYFEQWYFEQRYFEQWYFEKQKFEKQTTLKSQVSVLFSNV